MTVEWKTSGGSRVLVGVTVPKDDSWKKSPLYPEVVEVEPYRKKRGKRDDECGVVVADDE